MVYEGKRKTQLERATFSRTLAFYNNELYLRGDDGRLTKIDAPNSAEKGLHKQWLTLELRDPWTVGGTYASGSLLAIQLDDFAGKRDFELFTPTATTAGQRHLDQKPPGAERAGRRQEPPVGADPGRQPAAAVGAPAFGTLGVAAVDSNDSDAVWLTATDYLTPTTLALAEIGQAPETLKTMPAFFDAKGKVIEQHFATSKDGTRVPYFVVHDRAMKLDGSNPTLLYGYGGFEISLTPSYSGGMGRAWLEKGGVYVVANIRGGGEYGPRWHQAALKQNRHKAYDMAAVARTWSRSPAPSTWACRAAATVAC